MYKMTLNECIVKYIKTHRELIDELSIKDLVLYLEQEYDFGINPKDMHSMNSMRTFMNTVTSKKICSVFSTKNIKYILFKGVALSTLLNDKKSCRMAGDIDVYVEENSYDNALSILKDMGYKLIDEEGIKNEHHVSLENSSVIIELHKHIISPKIQIDEAYLLDHTEYITISNTNIVTFDVTATFLHLLYHLYMDLYLIEDSLYQIYTKKSIPTPKRFYYRAYEIILFSYVYMNQIKWDEVIADIKKQHLRIIYKIMILEINEIFPEFLPMDFVCEVSNLEYEFSDQDYVYKYLVSPDNVCITKKVEISLCKYINDYWNSRKNTTIEVGGDLYLSDKKALSGEDRLTCKITTKKTVEGIELGFSVVDKSPCFSDCDSFDTLKSDGVHLIICGTEEYSYHSIFFFPKKIDNCIKVLSYDVLNNVVIDTKLIDSSFTYSQGEYTITTILSNEFLSRNHIVNYFYMGLVISDCSEKEEERINELTLSDVSSEWYNPTYLAKIQL